MKKNSLILALFIFIFFFFNIQDVKAWYGDYNYEVTSMVKKDNSVTVKGWAILNGGVTSSLNSKLGFPNLEEILGSGQNDSKCTGYSTSYYSYTLYLVPLDADKNYDRKKALKVGTMNGSGTDLTSTMCQRNANNQCDRKISSCYRNVGWSFTYKTDVASQFQHGYILYLEVNAKSSSSNEAWYKKAVERLKSSRKFSVEFPLAIFQERIKGIDTLYYNYDGKTTVTNLKMKVIAYNGRMQKEPGIGHAYDEKNCHFEYKKIYDVAEISKNMLDGTYHYRLKIGQECKSKAKEGLAWSPASWLVPLEYYTTIIEPPDAPKDPNACTENSSVQRTESPTIKSCSGSATLSGDNYSSCSVNKYDYYTKKCAEQNFTANLNIGGVGNGVTSINLNNGGGFTATAKINTTFNCEYTFNVQKFKENYDAVAYNLNYYKNGTPEWNINNNIKKDLDAILTNYINQTKDLDKWSSNYNFTKLSAILDVDGDETSLVYDSKDLIHDTMDLNKDGKKDANYCATSKTEKVNGKDVNTEVSCGETWSISLQLPEVCLHVPSGDVESCIAGSKNQISGGRKYYVDLNKTSGNIKLKVTDLGYDGNWNVTLENCFYKTGKPIPETIKYREIDVADPFLVKYNPARGIGTNWKNTKFNFVNIIKSDIWDKDYWFAFDISKANVAKIVSNTGKNPDMYLGEKCEFVGGNSKSANFKCEFVRNTMYFTKIYGV